MSGESAERTPAAAWWTLVILMTFNIMSRADRNVIALLVGPIKHDLKLTDVQFGLVQGLAFALLYCVAGLPLGILADRVSRRVIMWGGVSIWSLGAAFSGLAQSLGGLFGARLAVGVGEASLQPCAFSMISGLFPRKRLSMAFGLFMTAANLGGGLALGLGGLLLGYLERHPLTLPRLGEVAPWRGVFLAIGLPGLLLALLAFVCREPLRGAAPLSGEPPAGFWRFLVERRGIIIRHFLGFPVLGMVVYGVNSWIPAYFIRRFGWEAHDIGPLLGLMALTMGAFWGIIGGVIIDRLTARGVRDATFVVHMTQAVIGAPICFAAFTVPDAHWALALLFIGMPIYQSFGAGSLASLQIITPAPLRGRMAALYVFMLTGVGFSTGPLLVATVTDVILRDEAKVGLSLLIVMAVLTPIALTSLASGRGRLRALADQAQAPTAAVIH